MYTYINIQSFSLYLINQYKYIKHLYNRNGHSQQQNRKLPTTDFGKPRRKLLTSDGQQAPLKSYWQLPTSCNYSRKLLITSYGLGAALSEVTWFNLTALGQSNGFPTPETLVPTRNTHRRPSCQELTDTYRPSWRRLERGAARALQPVASTSTACFAPPPPSCMSSLSPLLQPAPLVPHQPGTYVHTASGLWLSPW